MKLITATVQADKLEAIQQALSEPDVYLMYVSQVGDVREFLPGMYRGLEYPKPRPRLRLEVVVVNDLMVQDTIDSIVRVACVPNRERVGNGSIFVTPLESWIRIPADHPRPAPERVDVAYSMREAL